MFNQLSIGLRLWLNLLISVLFFSGLALSSWYGFNQAERSVEELLTIEQQRTQKIAGFHESFIQTVQAVNHYLLTLEKEAGEAFNERVDQQLLDLNALLEGFGAEIEVDGDGFLVLQSVPPRYENLVEPMFGLNEVLMNLKKSTNSYVFLKQNINSTIEFGLDPSAQTMIEAIGQLRAAAEESAEETVLTALNEIEDRVAISQLLAAKMVASNDVSYRDVFDAKALGDSANPLFETLAERYAMDFSVRDTLELLTRARDDYYDAFADLKDYLKTTVDNNSMLSSLSQQGNMTLIDLAGALQTQRVTTLNEVTLENRQSTEQLVWIGLMAIVVMVLLNITLRSSIVSPLKQMQYAVSEIAANSRFTSWKPLSGNNELVEMGRSIEQLLRSVGLATREINQVSEALASGDLQQTMQGDYQGDLADLSQAFNRSVERIQSTLQDIAEVSQALAQGQLHHEVTLDRYQGEYQSVMRSLLAALQVQHAAIDDVRHVTHAMREGDFSQRIGVDMPGDLANLKRYLNESLMNLEQAINGKAEALEHFSQGNFSFVMQGQYKGKLNELKDHMSGMAHSVSDMLHEVRHASEHAVHGIKEINEGNQDLNQRVQMQAAVVQKTSTRMGEMIITVNETQGQAQAVDQATRQVKIDSQAGVEIVQQMVEAMERIHQASQQVGQITEVIDSLSFQTNLLALNAAVEAARAGEAGRGFAVVASEVRNLAQKSAQAAKDIRQVTDANLNSIAEGLACSQSTQSVFEQNTQSIELIAEMIEKMNQALALQTHGIGEVSQALLDIDDATQQNAALVEQISSTSTRIIDEVLSLESKVQGFNLLAVNDTIPTPVLRLNDRSEPMAALAAERA